MRSGLLLLVLLAVPLRASGELEKALVGDAVVLQIFAAILEDGGVGFRETEAAAFLTIDENGRYRCEEWPFRNGHHKQVFRDALPEFTVAIAHTHPKRSRQPSRADRETARTTGLPVFVLTPRDIWVATPEGTVVPVVVNRTWAKEGRGASFCGDAPAPRVARVGD